MENERFTNPFNQSVLILAIFLLFVLIFYHNRQDDKAYYEKIKTTKIKPKVEK